MHNVSSEMSVNVAVPYYCIVVQAVLRWNIYIVRDGLECSPTEIEKCPCFLNFSETYVILMEEVFLILHSFRNLVNKINLSIIVVSVMCDLLICAFIVVIIIIIII
jgi:hypothetical protein